MPIIDPLKRFKGQSPRTSPVGQNGEVLSSFRNPNNPIWNGIPMAGIAFFEAELRLKSVIRQLIIFSLKNTKKGIDICPK